MTHMIVGQYTGDAYTVYRHEKLGCWTWRDSRGHGPSIGSTDPRVCCQSPDAAVDSVQRNDLIAAAEGDGSHMVREKYESDCARLSAEVLSDLEIREKSYTLRYGEFSDIDGHSPGFIASMALARRRLLDIEARPRDGALVSCVEKKTSLRCRRCGEPADMYASLGPACANHYDNLSD